MNGGLNQTADASPEVEIDDRERDRFEAILKLTTRQPFR